MAYQMDDYKCSETFIFIQVSRQTILFSLCSLQWFLLTWCCLVSIENSHIRKKSPGHLQCGTVHRVFLRHVLPTISKSPIDILIHHILLFFTHWFFHRKTKQRGFLPTGLSLWAKSFPSILSGSPLPSYDPRKSLLISMFFLAGGHSWQSTKLEASSAWREQSHSVSFSVVSRSCPCWALEVGWPMPISGSVSITKAMRCCSDRRSRWSVCVGGRGCEKPADKEPCATQLHTGFKSHTHCLHIE